MICTAFVAALLAAKGGEVLTLDPGQSCERIAIRKLAPSKPVTVRAHGATVNGLYITSANNLHWEGGTITAPGGMTARSPMDYAVDLRTGNNISFTGVTFTKAGRGIVTNRVNDLTVRDSRFEGLRSDGMMLAGVDGAVIERNVFRNFSPNPTRCTLKPTGSQEAGEVIRGLSASACTKRSGSWKDGDHPDGIQMYGDPIANIRINNNSMEGDMQSIGIFSNARIWPNARKERVVVRDNYIRSPRNWGIRLANCSNCEVTGNDLGRTPGGKAMLVINVKGSTGKFCGNKNPDAWDPKDVTVKPC